MSMERPSSKQMVEELDAEKDELTRLVAAFKGYIWGFFNYPMKYSILVSLLIIRVGVWVWVRAVGGGK